MQVSTIAELDTHVVIGGGEAKSFSMDDSAELYALLSDKIYRDKKRAAMREVICNAWDAHIMAGKTDVPVAITVTDTEIKIIDFGPGIPDELMHPIYCIYGKSTKVKDENQTGGFGLGSKAPFAVTDHFTVINQHAGFKTVYALSRGGVATEGRPEMRAMVRVPSNETGLSVSIPLQKAEDRWAFETHIRQVVQQGGMLATLNGIPLGRYDFTEARKHEFCVIPQTNLNEGRVYVLYGTVMYPLTNTDDAITHLTREAVKLIGTDSTLVLIPPPNSIGVTPSREALSFSPLTDETLTRLLKKAIRKIDGVTPAALSRFLRSWVEKRGPMACSTYIGPAAEIPNGLLSTPDMIADHAVRTSSRSHLSSDGMKRRVYKIAQKMFRDDRRFYRRAFKRRDSAQELTFRRTSMPAFRIASKMDLLKDLMLFDIYAHQQDHSGPKTRPAREIERTGEVVQTLFVARNLRDLRPMLGLAGRDFYDYQKNKYLPGLVLRQWTDKNIKTLKDLCAHYKIDLKLFDYEKAKAERKPVVRQTGPDTYFILEDINLKDRWADKAPTCTDPSFYLTTYQRDGILRFPSAAGHLFEEIIRKFPKTALITTKDQEEKLKKAGSRSLVEVMAKRLTELSKKREALYGETIRHSRFVENPTAAYSFPVVEAALTLAKKNVQIAKLLFPDRSTPGELHKEAAFIWDFLESIGYVWKESQEVVRDSLFGFLAACEKAFPPQRLARAETHFAYLRTVAGANFIDRDRIVTDDRFAADVIETIKFLQRREKARASVGRPNKILATNTNIALKEAA